MSTGVQLSLDRFDTRYDPEQVYPVLRPRDYAGKRVGTARRDLLAAMMRTHADAVEVYRKSDGESVEDVADFGTTIARHGHYSARVTLGANNFEDGRQVIDLDGDNRSYRVYVDASVVQWQE